MNRIFQLILLTILIGIAKGHHFIKLVILAGLGLAGLWMVHTLAQDFNGITSNNNQNKEAEFKLYKRSIAAYDDLYNAPKINWELVLSRDPASCARSFICQLVSTEENLLTSEEKTIIELTRRSAENDSWASKQLQEALKFGNQVSHPRDCMKIYKICPYSSQTMLTLLRVFGG